MDKKQRKSDIGFLSMVAALAKQCEDKPGVCSVGHYADARRFFGGITNCLDEKPGVLMTAKAFLEYFGEDTMYEFNHDKYGIEMITEVNGVMFHATICKNDLIKDGRLA